MPVQRSPLDIAVSDISSFSLPHSFIEAAIRQYTMTTIVDSGADTLMTYSPSTRRFIVVNPAGSATGEAFFTQSGNRWSLLADYNAGATYPMTPYAMASDGAGVILLGGHTDLSPTKIRRTLDAGSTWEEVNLGANNGDIVMGLGYSSALGLWFASMNIQGIFTSPDGADFNWTLRDTLPLNMGSMYFRNVGTPLAMFSPTAGAPTSGYFTTTNGTTFTARTFPATIAPTRGCYSAPYKTFYAHSATDTYVSSDAVAWSILDDYPTKLSPYEHLLLSGDGYVSKDGGASWVSIIETFESTDWIGSAHGKTLFRDGDSYFVSSATKL